MTDASDHAAGGVLQQFVDNLWSPIAFFSKKFSPRECHYSTFDRELPAVYFAVQKFRPFLEGRELHILTDHKPLTFALNTGFTSASANPRRLRQLSFVAEFTTDIRHVVGTENTLADGLSRISSISGAQARPPGINYHDLAVAQQTDSKLQSLRDSPNCVQYKYMTVQAQFSVTSLLVQLDRGYQSLFAAQLSTHSTLFPTPAYVHLENLSRRDLYGQE